MSTNPAKRARDAHERQEPAVPLQGPAPVELVQQRAFACRLTPDRALATLEDAEAFVADRGMLTLTPDCVLPSLFEACHEEPYLRGGHGFATWPKTKWWWSFALAQRPHITQVKIHCGRTLYLSAATVALADPLCRAELERARRGEYGPTANMLVSYLAAAGPSRLDDIKRELGLEAGALRAARTRLERVGAVVARTLVIPSASGGERETSELSRWDQLFPEPPGVAGGLGELLVAGVRAAVIAPEGELGRWFSWPLPPGLVDALVADGRLWRPQAGWVAAAVK